MTSRAIQWLTLHASTAGRMGLTPGWGTKMPHTMSRKQTTKNNCFKPFISLPFCRGKRANLSWKEKQFCLDLWIFPPCCTFVILLACKTPEDRDDKGRESEN